MRHTEPDFDDLLINDRLRVPEYEKMCRNAHFRTSRHTSYYRCYTETCLTFRDNKIHKSLSPHLMYPLITRVVGAPQMISQPVSAIFPCSSLPFGTLRTPGLSILSCCLPTSSSVCSIFFPLSLCRRKMVLARPNEPLHFAPLYDGQEVFVWSDCLLDLGTDFLVGNMVFV